MDMGNRTVPQRMGLDEPSQARKGRRYLNAAIGLVMTIAFGISINAQGLLSGMPSKQEAEAIQISESQKRALVDKLKQSIINGYILRDEASGVAQKIEAKFIAGAYDGKTDAYGFSKALTLDLREITNDSHFNVLYHPLLAKRIEQMLAAQANAERTEDEDNSSPQDATQAVPPPSKDAKRNFFFRKLEVLKGNVGYLKLELIPQISEAKPTLDFAMGFLGNTDAMIIDLRDNRGGFGGFISYFMSYFFPAEKKLLFSRELSIGETQQFYTELELPNKRLKDVPVYILINKSTGSAATNLAYTMQKHERAIVVGEATGVGKVGAHSAGPFPLVEGFVATIPVGRVVHAKTKSNWNITGVVPDIPTEGEAKSAAHEDALKKLDGKKPGGSSMKRLH